MNSSDGIRDDELRAVVREELTRAGRSLLGTIFWTLLAAFTILVGLQLVQIAFFTTSIVAATGFALGGILVAASSVYLLYLLHWK